jgi:hypothetical protein
MFHAQKRGGKKKAKKSGLSKTASEFCLVPFQRQLNKTRNWDLGIGTKLFLLGDLQI